MALDNFISTLWMANMMDTLEKELSILEFANRSYDGTIKKVGDKVKINLISDPTVKTHTGGELEEERLTDSQMEMAITEENYVNVFIPDGEVIDKKDAIITGLDSKTAYKFTDKASQYIANLHSKLGLKVNTEAEPVEVNSLNVRSQVTELLKLMTSNMLSKYRKEIVMMIPNWFYYKLLESQIVSKTQNDELIRTGEIKGFLGLKSIKVDDNVIYPMAGVDKQTWAYAHNLITAETLRSTTKFGDLIRAFHVFGGEIIDPRKGCTLYVTEGQEP